MQANIKTSLELLGVKTREYIIVGDETCWHPTLDVISGLRDQLGYVGGLFSLNAKDDKSFLSLSEMKECSEEYFAKLTQHYLVSKCDTNGQVFSINILPRAQKAAGLEICSGMEMVFQEMASLLHNACLANADLPPISVAYDAATAHSLVNRAFAGLVGPKVLSTAPFFQKCEVKPLRLACFSFGALHYKGTMPVLACLDLNHVCKRFAYHICSAGRTVMMGDFFIEVAALLRGGLGSRAYGSVDLQSDKDMASKLNVGFLTGLVLKKIEKIRKNDVFLAQHLEK